MIGLGQYPCHKLVCMVKGYVYILLLNSNLRYHRRRKMLEVEGALDINAREIFGHAHFYQNPRPFGRPRDAVGVHWHDFLGCSDQETNSK